MNKPSKTERGNVFRKTLLIAVAIISAILASLFYRNVVTPFLSEYFDPPVKTLQSFTLDQRPSGGMLLFDYAHILEGSEEGINNYLDRIRSQNDMELTILTIQSLSGIRPVGTVQETAFRIFNEWNIGRNNNGRGALILMVQDVGQVKIEVAQNMEDVFTDLFSGFAADQQLKPHLEQGTAGFALVAIMEEFEQRAYLKQTGNYTPDIIAARDRKFLSMGAGVQRRISDYNVQQNKKSDLP
ncbi:MAG: TPM domain-containing protein, partial [Alphaproteobacteria bacterium]|nr:TPM domain-containing protein [Alphaproteobacteria bacterium]